LGSLLGPTVTTLAPLNILAHIPVFAAATVKPSKALSVSTILAVSGSRVISVRPSLRTRSASDLSLSPPDTKTGSPTSENLRNNRRSKGSARRHPHLFTETYTCILGRILEALKIDECASHRRSRTQPDNMQLISKTTSTTYPPATTHIPAGQLSYQGELANCSYIATLQPRPVGRNPNTAHRLISRSAVESGRFVPLAGWLKLTTAPILSSSAVRGAWTCPPLDPRETDPAALARGPPPLQMKLEFLWASSVTAPWFG